MMMWYYDSVSYTGVDAEDALKVSRYEPISSYLHHRVYLPLGT